MGYSAEAFASAPGFLASSRVEQTACLIADVNMPRMTGIELHRHLVETGQAIPTILVTAYPNEADRVRAASDGVVCYLRKPIDEDELTHVPSGCPHGLCVTAGAVMREGIYAPVPAVGCEGAGLSRRRVTLAR